MWKLKSNASASAARKTNCESPKPKSSMLPSARTASLLRSSHEQSRLRHRCDELHFPGLLRAAGQHHLTERDPDQRRPGISAHAASHYQGAQAGIHGSRIREKYLLSLGDVHGLQSKSK